MLGIKSFSQDDQKALIAAINTKLNKVDSVIIEGDKKNILLMMDEILSMSENIENKKTQLVAYNVYINKYIEARLFPNAINLCLSSIQKAEDIYGPKHINIAYFLTMLALSYSYDDQIHNAIKYGKQSVEMLEELGEYGEVYLMAIGQLTTYYNESYQFPECIEMLKRCVQHIDTNKIPKSSLAIIYGSLADNYSNLNNNILAQHYKEKALDLYEDQQSLDYLRIMQELAMLYSKNNNHEKAIHLINEVCNRLRIKNEDVKYVLALCDKASIYIHTGEKEKIDEAIEDANEAINQFETKDMILSDDYVHSLMTLAEAYNSLDLFDKSRQIYKRVYDLQKQYLDKNNIYDLEILAISAVIANELQEGLSLHQILKNRIMQEKGEKRIDYAKVVYRLSELYYLLNDYENAIKNIMEVFPIMRGELAKSFFQLEDNERADFWNKYYYVFSESLPRMCYSSPNPTFSWLMFDATLLSKGILLNTERVRKKLLQNEASVEDFGKPFFLNWRDIRAKLKDDDIAIEIVKVSLYNKKPAYVALTIRRQYEWPRMTTLFTEDEIKQVPDTLYYQCKEMTNLVWTPLLPELEGIKNIYFSPSGALYNIGIEYLPGMEDFNIFRLSSTRELVTGKRIRTGNSAVLYGGLDYYAKLDTLNRSLATPNDTFVEHIDVKGINIRGGRNRLPHTKEEVENIATELRKANWTCLLDTMSLGTEESFKSLSGMGTNTLHIATHGFYYTPEKANETGYKFLQLDNQTASAEDKALTRSGLIMSGANLVLEHKELPDNIEDGILTAKEIADVDLRGLDLVVLSACQTGLGDISQGEGVFGLQRGFKKAGANTILMSLWKVNDKATKTLMIQFYKNWLMGYSKRNALRLAQKHLREIEGGKYNEPKYWAAFILLDGIDLAN